MDKDMDEQEQPEQQSEAVLEEHKVVLTPREEARTSGPGLWVALICFPVLLGLLVSLGRDGEPEAPKPPPAYEPTQGGRGGAVGGVTSNWAANIAVQEAASMKAKPSGYACDFTPWVGGKVSEDILSAIKGAERPYRILPPGSAVTMDHNPARINFDLDSAGTITRVWCG